MRQFFIGAICGAAVSALTLLIVDSGNRTTPLVVEKAQTASGQEPDGSTKEVEKTRQGQSAAQQQVALEPTKISSSSHAVVSVHAPIADTSASIKLSADHAKMLSPQKRDDRPLTLPELHMQLTTEAKDANWASEMEQSLGQFISQTNTTAEFEILTIECRATLCEILAYGNLPNSPQHWNIIGDEMSKQSWWSNFKGNSTSSSGKNGRTTIVTILQIK
jgi:hypothetical protein